MVLRSVAVLLALALPRVASAECDVMSQLLTTGDRTLRSIFAVVDAATALAYDEMMPGEVVTFRRLGGRWMPVLPTSLSGNTCLRENLEKATAFYGDSIDFSAVTIRMGANLTKPSWVFHNRVMIGRGKDCPTAFLLVHELGHVWQYQHYQWQMAGGIVDQIRHSVFDADVYALDRDRVLRYAREGRTLPDFNRERQAELFAHYFWATANDLEIASALAPIVQPSLERRPTWGAGLRYRAPR